MTTTPVPAGPRHRAPETDDEPTTTANSAPSRHAASPWDRELYDARLDEDPFDWLGFAPEAA